MVRTVIDQERARLAAALARLLELEYPCERCHHRPASELFDRVFVCAPCRRAMEKRLVRRG